MTTGLTYSQFVTQIATLAVVAEDDAAFVIILPQTITYAENRIYRDLDFLVTQTSITGNSLTAGNRSLTIAAGTIVTSQQINIITPAPTTNPNIGTRNPCLPATKEYLDAVYGDSSYTGLPKYFVPFNDNVFLFGPFPDANYGIEIVGTYRPASLSVSNTTTFISNYLPDLLIMASMIYVSGYQRNFNKTGTVDEPAMAVTYETQYQTLLKGATVEEFRKKFMSGAWSSETTSPIATPSR